MRNFFEQFGDILNLKLSRSKKGRSKGYAFVEFTDGIDTAKIVADTMNGYMMFGQTIRSHVLETRAIHKDLFKGTDKPFRVMPTGAIAAQSQNSSRTVSAEAKRIERLKKKEEVKRAKLNEMGIKYQFPGYTADQSTAPAPEPKQSKSSTSSKKKKNTSSKKKKQQEQKPDKSQSKKKEAVVATPTSGSNKKTPAAPASQNGSQKKKDVSNKVEAVVTPTSSKKKRAAAKPAAAATEKPAAKKQKK
jgi:nucleolar protein 15